MGQKAYKSMTKLDLEWKNTKMRNLYLMKVDYEVQSLDPQSLKLPNPSPMNSSFGDAHKNTLRPQISHKVARVLTYLNKGLEDEHGEALKEL